jgi:hypothetical protein
VPDPRFYLGTLILDIAPPEDAIFADLHPTARRHVRAVAKNPVTVGPVSDPAQGPRLETLIQESFGRSGGSPPDHDWANLIRFSRSHPGLSRIVGLYEEGRAEEDSLLAFAWGCFHGDHAHYAAAGSTRDTELNMPLTYGLVWDLILWAKLQGAVFFDLGGITSLRPGPGDPREGIARFKRSFSTRFTKVGAEVFLEPNPLAGSLVRTVGSGARAVTRWLGKARRRME